MSVITVVIFLRLVCISLLVNTLFATWFLSIIIIVFSSLGNQIVYQLQWSVSNQSFWRRMTLVNDSMLVFDKYSRKIALYFLKQFFIIYIYIYIYIYLLWLTISYPFGAAISPCLFFLYSTPINVCFHSTLYCQLRPEGKKNNTVLYPIDQARICFNYSPDAKPPYCFTCLSIR